MSRTEETRSLLNESLNNNNFEKEREDEDDNFSPGCFGTTLLYIFLKIFDWGALSIITNQPTTEVITPTYINPI